MSHNVKDHLEKAKSLANYRSDADAATAHAVIALVERLDIVIAHLRGA